jgi:hypothetical protein
MPVSPEKRDMARAPKTHCIPSPGLPELSLPAILGFAVVGCGGAAFLAYTSFSFVAAKPSPAASSGVKVYEARAVPFDSPRENPAERAASIARVLVASGSEAQRIQSPEQERTTQISGPTLLADSGEGLRGFSRFSNFGGANSYLAITGANFGISAQMSPMVLAAPDAETAVSSVVPEGSTWLCGAVVLALIAARGARAIWHRNQRRGSNRPRTRV